MNCHWEVKLDLKNDEWSKCIVDHVVEEGEGEEHIFINEVHFQDVLLQAHPDATQVRNTKESDAGDAPSV